MFFWVLSWSDVHRGKTEQRQLVTDPATEHLPTRSNTWLGCSANTKLGRDPDTHREIEIEKRQSRRREKLRSIKKFSLTILSEQRRKYKRIKFVGVTTVYFSWYVSFVGTSAVLLFIVDLFPNLILIDISLHDWVTVQCYEWLRDIALNV